MFYVYLIVWTRQNSKCTLLVSFRARRTHTHTLQPGEQHLSCGLYFQRFIIKHVQQFSHCKDGILQQSTNDLILTLSFGQGGTNARRCEGKEVALEETRL